MMCFLAQNNIVSGIFASNLLRLKNHQLFRELLEQCRNSPSVSFLILRFELN
jgi:hypothetical protein